MLEIPGGAPARLSNQQNAVRATSHYTALEQINTNTSGSSHHGNAIACRASASTSMRELEDRIPGDARAGSCLSGSGGGPSPSSWTASPLTRNYKRKNMIAEQLVAVSLAEKHAAPSYSHAL